MPGAIDTMGRAGDRGAAAAHESRPLPAPAERVPPMPLGKPEAEVERVMAICNACRYCEGFCAVFPAMERRLDFGHGDIHFLANLCHNCGACLHACQYAPPHAFAVNVPKALAEVRAVTYERYAWPAAWGALYRHQGLWLALALVAGLVAFYLLALQLYGGIFGRPATPGNFYAVI